MLLKIATSLVKLILFSKLKLLLSPLCSIHYIFLPSQNNRSIVTMSSSSIQPIKRIPCYRTSRVIITFITCSFFNIINLAVPRLPKLPSTRGYSSQMVCTVARFLVLTAVKILMFILWVITPDTDVSEKHSLQVHMAYNPKDHFVYSCFPMHAACPTHLLDLNTVTILCEEYKLKLLFYKFLGRIQMFSAQCSWWLLF